MRLQTAVLAAYWLAIFGSGGCQREQSATALFPAANEAAGWMKTSDIRTFEAADLWKYIDGEAERYLKGGVQRVSTADYKYQNQIDVVLDIYVMGNAKGAARILDSEPTGDAKSPHLGDAARLYGESLVFRKDYYLVRIVAYQDSAEIPQVLLELGRAIERRIENRRVDAVFALSLKLRVQCGMHESRGPKSA